MKNNRIIAMSAAIALAFATATPAQAQFGNVLNKAKKAVKEKVEKTVENTTEAAKQKATDTATGTAKDAAGKAGVSLPQATGNTDGGTGSITGGSGADGATAPLHKRDLTPSPEAIANDPQALDETVAPNFTRSHKQVHAVYERLDPELFPLQPYYKYPVMYGLGKWSGQADKALLVTMKNILTAPAHHTAPVYLVSNEQIPELVSPDGQSWAVHEDDVYRYPFAAAFFADPNSKQGVYRLAMILAGQSIAVRAVRAYTVKSETGVADATKGWMFPYAAHDVRSRREDMMCKIACNDVDIELINQVVLELYQAMEAQKPGYLKAAYMLAANELYDNVLKEHKDHAANKSKYNKALMLHTRYDNGKEHFDILRGAMAQPAAKK